MTMQTLHPLDAALFGAAPTFMMPRYGQIAELAVGAKRFLAASTGMFLEVRSPVMHACIRVTTSELPYGDADEFIHLTRGPVPQGLIQRALASAIAASPNEMALAIVADSDSNGYGVIDLPPQNPSSCTITYEDVIDDDALVFDIHSHGSTTSFFSGTDDASDKSRRGPYIALVFGKCIDAASVTVCARFCCSPYLIDLSIPSLKTLQVIL